MSTCHAQQSTASPAKSAHAPEDLATACDDTATLPFINANVIANTAGTMYTSELKLKPTVVVMMCGLSRKPCVETDSSDATKLSSSVQR